MGERIRPSVEAVRSFFRPMPSEDKRREGKAGVELSAIEWGDRKIVNEILLAQIQIYRPFLKIYRRSDKEQHKNRLEKAFSNLFFLNININIKLEQELILQKFPV
ncbi:hypothetical protein COF72_00395 [Bacillus pseudomycoides]|nr:hypothetical protein COF72_00395 [Bacillus pseudomycoides]